MNPSEMAASYKERFALSMKFLAEQTLKHRLWISDRWTDTQAGEGQESKMLEYACGPGVISMVRCINPFDRISTDNRHNAKRHWPHF